MTTVWTVVFGLVFFALLMVSVALHEIGHLVPAKIFGVKVPKYFVGFGRTLWSRSSGETEYGVKLWPLGGFVQLLGMYPPADPAAKQTKLQRFADGARSVEWDDITAADTGRLFYAKPVWQKLIIMSGGIAMNLLIAFLLLWGVIGLHGVWRPQPVVHSVQQCIIAAPRPDATCQASDPPTPAAQAGLRPGDRVLSFNATPISDYPQLTGLIRSNLDREARLEVERDGVRMALPLVNTRLTAVRDPLDPSRIIQAGWLGVTPVHELQRGGPGRVVADMAEMSAMSVVTLVQFPVKVFNVVADLVTGKPRDIYGPISIVGASSIAGSAAASDNPVTEKVVMFASLLASVNLFLALFNLVPLPPLDGGHLVGALYESLRRQVARLTGRPDPGPVDTAKMLPIAYLVGGFLLLCGIVLIVADIVAPMKLF